MRHDARRNGVARALISELSSRITTGGGAWITWVMLATNADGHAFYDAIGAARRPEIAFRVLDLRAPTKGSDTFIPPPGA